MDVVNRDKREKDLEAALMEAWKDWTNVSNPETLKKEDLEKLLIERCLDPLWAVWIQAHGELAREFQSEEDHAAAAAAFMLFVRRWTDDLGSRWTDRVQGFVKKPAPKPAPKPTTVKPDTKPQTVIDDPVQGFPIPTSPKPAPVAREEPSRVSVGTSGEHRPSVSTQTAEAKVDWKEEGRHDTFTKEDAEMTAVTTVTMTHSIAEEVTVTLMEEQSVTVIGIYRTEPGACSKCEPFEGKEVFGPEGPNQMPPLHPNCRCWVEHVLK